MNENTAAYVKTKISAERIETAGNIGILDGMITTTIDMEMSMGRKAGLVVLQAGRNRCTNHIGIEDTRLRPETGDLEIGTGKGKESVIETGIIGMPIIRIR